MSDKDKVQYCFNPATKEVVEGANPPSCNFIPIVGYFPRTLVNEDLQRKIEEIASLQENALDYDQYEDGKPETPTPTK